MALGGFDNLTPEQEGKCLLLGFKIYWGGAVSMDSWYAAKTDDQNYMRVMVYKDTPGLMAKFDSVDELLEAYANDPSKFGWV